MPRLIIMLLTFTAVLTFFVLVSVAVKIEEIEANDIVLNIDVPERHSQAKTSGEIEIQENNSNEIDDVVIDIFDPCSPGTWSVLKTLWKSVGPWLVTPSGVIIFTALASAASALLALDDVPMPGSVVMLVLLTLTLFLGPEGIMNSIAAFLDSGSVLLRIWQSVMLSTALVSLPLSVNDFTLYQGLGLVAIEVGEWFLVLLQAGYSAMLLQKILRRYCCWPTSYGMLPADANPPADANSTAAANSTADANSIVPSSMQTWQLTAADANSTAAANMTAIIPSSGAKPLIMPTWLLTTTIVGTLVSMVPFLTLEHEGRWTAFCVMSGLAVPSFYCLGEMIKNYCGLPVPATVLTAVFALMLNFLMTATVDDSYKTVFEYYSTDAHINMFTGISDSIGPANLYLFFVNSAIVAMALPIFEYKKEVMTNGIALGINSAVTMFRSMITPVVFAKLCKLSPLIARTLSMRTAAAAIAMASIRFVDGDVPLAGAVGVMTGAIGALLGIPMMNLLGWKDPMIRGFAMGASSSGLGTAVAMIEEPESAAWAVVGYMSIGVWGTLFIVLPPTRNLIYFIADQELP